MNIISKTGQTIIYAIGDDGFWQKGIDFPVPRFTDNLDGTVTDNLTGLIWLKNANRFGENNWYDAIQLCNNLKDDGVELTDGSIKGYWRLPNIKELLSLYHYGFVSPALPNTEGTGQWKEGDPFLNVVKTFYWSSTTHGKYTDRAFRVSFAHGGGFRPKNLRNRMFLWCVK